MSSQTDFYADGQVWQDRDYHLFSAARNRLAKSTKKTFWFLCVYTESPIWCNICAKNLSIKTEGEIWQDTKMGVIPTDNKEDFIMKALKKEVATVVAAASIMAIGVTASAAETVNKLPVDWIAVKANGAPTSVNKTYYYPVYLSGEGYDITCTTFESDYDGTVEVGRQYRALNGGVILSLDENITDLHNKTRTPIHVENPSSVYDDYITFSFYAHCINNCRAGGTISRDE